MDNNKDITTRHCYSMAYNQIRDSYNDMLNLVKNNNITIVFRVHRIILNDLSNDLMGFRAGDMLELYKSVFETEGVNVLIQNKDFIVMPKLK